MITTCEGQAGKAIALGLGPRESFLPGSVDMLAAVSVSHVVDSVGVGPLLGGGLVLL